MRMILLLLCLSCWPDAVFAAAQTGRDDLARALLTLRSSLAEGRQALDGVANGAVPPGLAKVQADELADLLHGTAQDIAQPSSPACEPARVELHRLVVDAAGTFQRIARGELDRTPLETLARSLGGVPTCAG